MKMRCLRFIKYCPLLNSKDFISNYPAIWQKLSSIENIINLINYANGEVIWKRNACCTTTASTLWICAEIIWIHPAVSEELRGNEILHRFYPETIQHSHANERGDVKMRCLRFIKGLPSTQQWTFHPKLPRHLAEIIKYRKYNLPN
jgi:hypothetical protein